MPCSVSQEEADAYAKLFNEKKYGVSELDSRIIETVACELSKIIEANNLQGQLSNLAKKWIKEHKDKDANR
jgi:hypothetical protein